MKQAGLWLLTGMLLFAAASCGGPADEGPVLVTLEEPDSPFVAIAVWVRAGSQNDPAGKEGLASLTADLLAEGSTQELAYSDILSRLYPMATRYEASVDKEMTVFQGTVHRDNLEEFYALLRDAVLRPGFRPEDFERIKQEHVNYVERMRRFSSDEELGKELLYREIFRGTPYEHPVEGYVKSVKSLELADVQDFYRRYYVRNNIVVGVGGGYPAGFPERVRQDFATLPRGEVVQPPRPQPQPVEGIHALIVEKQTKATAISLGFPIAVTRSDADFWPLFVANSWLGEHRNSASHLYQVIRETRGMNYGDYSYIEAFPMGHRRNLPPVNVSRRSQIFQIWIRPVSMLRPGDLHDRALFATRAALRELRRLVEQGLTAEEFETTRNFLRNYTVNYGSTLSRRLGYALDDLFYGLQPEGFLAQIPKALEALKADEVNAAVKRHLQADNFWIVFITEDAEGLKQKLLSGAETPIQYPTEKPAEVLEEDREIQKYPIPIREENIRIVPVEQVFEE
ncbi:MAG: hypothetical protein Kow00109_12230 [Acidobacteriota bacterium]